MAAGRPHLNRRTAIFVIAGTVLLGGAAYLAKAPHGGVGLPIAAKPAPADTGTITPAGVSTSSATADVPPSPAVAGATTTAPAAPRTAAKPAPAAPAAAPPAAVAPVPTINLTLIDPGGTFSYAVRLQPGADACTVLEQAKAEGKISFLDIDYSYLNSSLKSAYVRQINSYANNWTVKVNGTAPLGCSLVSPKINDNITWRYQ